MKATVKNILPIEALNIPEHTARQEDSSSGFRRLPITPFTDSFQGPLFVFIEPRSSGVPMMVARGTWCKGVVFNPLRPSSTSRSSTAGTSLGQEPAYSFQKLAPDLRGQLFNQFHPLSGRYRHHIGYWRYGTADDDSGGRGQLKSRPLPPADRGLGFRDDSIPIGRSHSEGMPIIFTMGRFRSNRENFGSKDARAVRIEASRATVARQICAKVVVISSRYTSETRLS